MQLPRPLQASHELTPSSSEARIKQPTPASRPTRSSSRAHMVQPPKLPTPQSSPEATESNSKHQRHQRQENCLATSGTRVSFRQQHSQSRTRPRELAGQPLLLNVRAGAAKKKQRGKSRRAAAEIYSSNAQADNLGQESIGNRTQY